MSSILSYNSIISIIKDISERHYQINSFGVGSIADFDIAGNMTAPILWVTPIDGTLIKSDDASSYPVKNITLELRLIDLVNPNQNNANDVHSDTFQILTDVVNEIDQHPYYQRSQLQLDGDVNLEPLEEWSDDDGNGWVARITFKMKNHTAFCGLPLANINGYSYPGYELSAFTYSTGYLPIIGGNLTGPVTGPSAYFISLSGDNIFSGSTNLNTILANISGGSGTQTLIQNGLNTYTAGTSQFPSVNISSATLTNLVATNITGTTYWSGNTSLNNILSNYITGFTDSFVTGVTFTDTNNTLTLNRNNGLSPLTTNISSFSGLTILNNLTATTYFSGATTLNSILSNYITNGTNLGGANGIVDNKSGSSLQFLSISAGTNITITSGASVITINSTASGSGGGFTGWTAGTGVSSIRLNSSTNSTNSNFSLVAGGSNSISGSASSTIAGGITNAITSGRYNFIGGGRVNNITSGYYGAIAGGRYNTIGGYYNFIGGGRIHTIGNSKQTFIGSGLRNTINSNCNYSTIIGGRDSIISANVRNGFIGNGSGNTITAAHGGIILGGTANTTSSVSSFIGNGRNNNNAGNFASILNGSGNTINSIATSSAIVGASNITAVSANTTYMASITLPVSGSVISITSGNSTTITGKTFGLSILTGGTVVVANSKVTANSAIFITPQNNGTGNGSVWISARSAGVSFTIASTNILDDRLVAWWIIEPIL